MEKYMQPIIFLAAAYIIIYALQLIFHISQRMWERRFNESRRDREDAQLELNRQHVTITDYQSKHGAHLSFQEQADLLQMQIEAYREMHGKPKAPEPTVKEEGDPG
jgi:hypothetical protein